MGEDIKKQAKAEEPKFDKDQYLSSPEYTLGEKCFITSYPESDFPMSRTQINKKLGVKK